MTKILFLCISLLTLGIAQAQDRNDAIVFIQGDKEVPIYIKMEDQMMERFSKNYFILNGLAGGALHIQVLFQKNKYPVQNFILNIPPSTQRSFVLQKVGEKSFALYDLNYGVTIPAGNKLGDDIDLSNRQTAIAVVPKVEKVAVIPGAAKETKKTKSKKSAEKDELPAFVVKKEKEQPIPNREKEDKENKEKETIAKTEKAKTEKTKTPIAKKTKEPRAKTNEPVAKTVKSKEPVIKQVKTKDSADRFLAFEIDKSKEEKTTGKKSTESTQTTDSKCSKAISEVQFKSLLTRMSGYDDTEKKLKYLRSQSKYNCYSSTQIGEIATDFKDQSSRYILVKSLKERVVDPEEYKKLESLFNTAYLKKKFLNEIAK